MYEIRRAGVKGLGVFANTYIPRGSRILSEPYLLQVAHLKDVYRATRSLSPEDGTVLKGLSLSSVPQSPIRDWAESAWHAVSAVSSSLLASKDRETTRLPFPSWTSIADHVSTLNIFRNNNFDLGDGTQAVFRQISRLNHACAPNAQGNFNTAIGRFTIHAVRAIQEGDEITLSYLAEQGALRASRQSRLQRGYGFLCDCTLCLPTSAHAEAGEQRRSETRARLQAYAEGFESHAEPDPAAELAMTVALIEMFEAEGLCGRELATTYLSAAEMSTKLDEKEVSLRYCRRGLEMDKDCLGEDNPFYEQSLQRMRAIGLSD